MSMPRLPTTVPALALLAGAIAQQFELTHMPHPASYPIAVGAESWLTYRIVDDITGQPIADAELHLIPEHPTPLPGRFWSTRSARSDALGIVRVRVDAIARSWHWLIVRANGYAPVTEQHGFPTAVIRMPRQLDVPVLVRDWADRPVAAAEIAFCGGSGGTPDLATAASGPDGRALLRGIDASGGPNTILVLHPDCDLGHGCITWFPGEPPAVVRCGHAQPIAGRLLDGAGQPLIDTPVGTWATSRGPWTLTGPDGTFRLLGAPAGAELLVSGQHCDMDLSPVAELPGTWMLTKPGSQAPATPERSAPSRPTTRIEVQIEAREADHLMLQVVTPSLSVDCTVHWPVDPLLLSVPTEEPFAIDLISHTDRRRAVRRTFAFRNLDDLAHSPQLQWFEPTRVTGRLIDENDHPVDAELCLLPWPARPEFDDPPPRSFSAERGRFTVPTELQGTSLLRIQPGNAELPPRLLWVTLPARADRAEVRLGTITLRRHAQLRVLDDQGAPLAGHGVGMARTNQLEPGRTELFPVREDGAWLGPDLRAGDAIVIAADEEDDPPFRTVLRGEGPWEIRRPAGGLRLQVQDEHGGPLAAEGVLDDAEVEIDGERILNNLAPGPHSLIVGAEGWQTAIATVFVPVAGRAELRITLPVRSATPLLPPVGLHRE